MAADFVLARVNMASRSLAMVALAACVGVPSSAMAFPFGISGFSGKQGSTCNSCHGGGVAPTVSFSGPTTLGVGETATYTFTVHANGQQQSAAGFDVAASGGTFQTVSGQDEQLIGNELGHVQPLSNDANHDAAFMFEWQAPAVAGTYTLFGAGNSVNLDGTDGGDRAAATQLSVTVTDQATPAVPTPTPTPTPTPILSASPTPGSGCSGDCNHDGMVTVSEIVTLVNIALGQGDASACSAGDVDHDGMISINELIAAVNRALNGCAAS